MTRSLVPWMRRFPGSLVRFEEDLWNRLFGNDEQGRLSEEWFTPLANVAETDKALEVTVEVPGMKPEDFKVELHNGDLWVSGEVKEEKEEKEKTYHRIERRYGQFRRIVPLPEAVDREHVNATYEGGVLKVTLAKTEQAKPRRIEVKC